MDNYDGYNYEVFKAMAKDGSLSSNEKVGFPDSYRVGFNDYIVSDIISKVPQLTEKKNLKVLDIGAGCSDVSKQIRALCKKQGHEVYLADSQEMLDLIPDEDYITKIPGLFPKTTAQLKELAGGFDVIICYSVFHYIFVDSNVWHFLDCFMDCLNDGGQAILGDIPNVSKRKRFFASNNGIKFHQEFMKTTEKPEVEFNCIEAGKIDDTLLTSVVLKCQSSGYDAYVVPQNKRLPFANRRDDIIIRMP